MAFDPRLTAYQIPYEPIFETTKQEIERSLFSLEEKLRRRREIDLEVGLQRDLARTMPLKDHYYQTLREAEERERMQRNMLQQELRLQAASDLAHLERIEQLKIERDNLSRQAGYAAQASRYQPPIVYPSSPSDEDLLRKYQDGSKAKEYYRDLQKQLKKQEDQDILDERAQLQREYKEREKIKDLIEKQQKHQSNQRVKFEHQTAQSNQRADFATPYDYIKGTNPQQQPDIIAKKQERAHLTKELEKQFDKLEQDKHSKSTHKMAYNNSTYRNNSPVKLLKDNSAQQSKLSPYHQKMIRTQSLGRMPCNRSNPHHSPHKTSILEASYLQAKQFKPEVKPSVKEIELSAIKKIQNRLKVSKVIYEDSRFRNNKYEGNHLFNTFEIESRCRKQIKEKINGHPFVLRKHALVVE